MRWQTILTILIHEYILYPVRFHNAERSKRRPATYLEPFAPVFCFYPRDRALTLFWLPKDFAEVQSTH
jgi:hypothetical protein